MTEDGNGFRVTTKDVYAEVKLVRLEVAELGKLLITEKGRVNGLTTQIRLLWMLTIASVGTGFAAALRGFTS